MIILLMQMISITLNLIGIETLSGDVLPQTGESFVGVDLDTAEQNCNLMRRKQKCNLTMYCKQSGQSNLRGKSQLSKASNTLLSKLKSGEAKVG